MSISSLRENWAEKLNPGCLLGLILLFVIACGIYQSIQTSKKPIAVGVTVQPIQSFHVSSAEHIDLSANGFPQITKRPSGCELRTETRGLVQKFVGTDTVVVTIYSFMWAPSSGEACGENDVIRVPVSAMRRPLPQLL